MPYLLFLGMSACAQLAPAPAPDVVAQPVLTVSVSVPANCPHLILDVMPASRTEASIGSDVTVACFGAGVDEAFYRNHVVVEPIGRLRNTNVATRLSVDYLPMDQLLAATKPPASPAR